MNRITPGVAAATWAAFAKTSSNWTAAKSPEHGEGRQQEAEIADAVGDHGLLGGVRVGPGRPPERIHLVPEADQQERAQAHAFPADEQHQVRVAADQDHHHGDEQVHEDEEAAVAAHVVLEAHVLVHVADGVDVDERAHAGDDQHHRHRERIHPEVPGDVQRADVDPVGERDDVRLRRRRSTGRRPAAPRRRKPARRLRLPPRRWLFRSSCRRR